MGIKLGFIGLGIMGKPMALKLLKAKDDSSSELLVADLNKDLGGPCAVDATLS